MSSAVRSVAAETPAKAVARFLRSSRCGEKGASAQCASKKAGELTSAAAFSASKAACSASVSCRASTLTSSITTSSPSGATPSSSSSSSSDPPSLPSSLSESLLSFSESEPCHSTFSLQKGGRQQTQRDRCKATREDEHDALLEAAVAVKLVELKSVEIVKGPFTITGLEDSTVAVNKEARRAQ